MAFCPAVSVHLEGDELQPTPALDLQHDRVAPLEPGEQIAEGLDVGDGQGVYRVDHVSGLQLGPGRVRGSASPLDGSAPPRSPPTSPWLPRAAP